MKPFKLEIEINKVTFSKTFMYDFSFIDFVKALWDETPNDLKPETVVEGFVYIRKFTAYKIVEYNRTEEVFNCMSDALNRGMDIKEFVERYTRDHRTLQQKFTSLCLAWVETVGSENYTFDGRNEYSHRQCAQIVEFMRKNNISTFMPLI